MLNYISIPCRQTSIRSFSTPIGKITPIKQKPKPVVYVKRKSAPNPWGYYLKQTGYFFFVMAGLGITGVTLFGLGNELFGSQHGQDLYEEASNMIMVSPTIKKHFKAYYTSQNLPGGRNLLIQEKVKRRGKNGIKIQFYLIGQGKAGICYAESYVEGDKYVIEDVHVESGGLIYKVYQREGSVRGSWFGFASDSGWWRKE